MLQIRMPDAVHGQVKKLAHRQHVSINQFLVSSVSNEVIRQETSEFFGRRGAHYDEQAFLEALSAVHDGPPVEGDELPTPKTTR